MPHFLVFFNIFHSVIVNFRIKTAKGNFIWLSYTRMNLACHIKRRTQDPSSESNAQYNHMAAGVVQHDDTRRAQVETPEHHHHFFFVTDSLGLGEDGYSR